MYKSKIGWIKSPFFKSLEHNTKFQAFISKTVWVDRFKSKFLGNRDWLGTIFFHSKKFMVAAIIPIFLWMAYTVTRKKFIIGL